MMSPDEKLHIATIGKCVGLRGDLKLHLYTDFPQQFQPGKTFITDKNTELTIVSYQPQKSLVQFAGYHDRESAARLTNQKLFTTIARSKAECGLKEGEYFWFEVVGASIEEAGALLGKVAEIERIADTDYLIVTTDAALTAQGFPRRFYIPYIPRYIISFDPDTKVIATQGARDILEAS